MSKKIHYYAKGWTRKDGKDWHSNYITEGEPLVYTMSDEQYESLTRSGRDDRDLQYFLRGVVLKDFPELDKNSLEAIDISRVENFFE